MHVAAFDKSKDVRFLISSFLPFFLSFRITWSFILISVISFVLKTLLFPCLFARLLFFFLYFFFNFKKENSPLHISNCLTTPRNTVLQNLTDSQQVKKFPKFYGPEGLLMHSQDPASCPDLKPQQSSPPSSTHPFNGDQFSQSIKQDESKQ